MMETGKTEKWGVVAPISRHMSDFFTDEELVTFGKVLAMYTLPEGEPTETPRAEIVKNVITDGRMIRAFVRVEGVRNTDTTFNRDKLYEGAKMTPDDARGGSGSGVTVRDGTILGGGGVGHSGGHAGPPETP